MMLRTAFVSAVAFMVLVDPASAEEARQDVSRRLAALIGEPSQDPSAQPLVVEIDPRTQAASEIADEAQKPTKLDYGLLGLFGAWDLEKPGRRQDLICSISGALPDSARFDAAPIRVQPRLTLVASNMAPPKAAAPKQRAAVETKRRAAA
jgi:hypothetical protein